MLKDLAHHSNSETDRSNLEMLKRLKRLEKFDSSNLIDDIHPGNVLIVLGDELPVLQEVEDVEDGGGHPASPLVEELVESLRTGGV